MKPFVKYGLIVGVVSLVVIIPVAVLVGLCGPLVAVIGGAVAGFLTAHFGNIQVKKTGAQQGALAGLITGVFTLVGQIISGLLALTLIQATETPVLFGEAPTFNSPASEQMLFYVGGIGAGACFGLIGLGVAAGFGALAGYLGTKAVEGNQVIDAA